jgi:hypothetical protein
MLSLLPCLLAAVLAGGNFVQVVVPSGFSATSIPFGAEVTGMAIANGGAFGVDLYGSTNGEVRRVDIATGAVTPFASGLATGNDRPSGLAFDKGAFGTGLLYVAQNNSTVVKISSAGAVSPFASGGSLFSCNGLVMAPVGSAFGAKLFVSNGNPGSGTLSSVSAAGGNALFAAAGNFANAPLGVDFPAIGSAFGSDLFTSVFLTGQIVRVNASGSGVVFATGTGQSLDMRFSPDPLGPFGDFAYITDTLTNSVRRVAPDASVTTFASGFVFGTSGFDGDISFAPDGKTLFVASGTSIIAIRSVGASAFSDLGSGLPGISGIPHLAGTGTLAPASACSLSLTSAAASKPALLFVALASVPAPFKGGVLVATPVTSLVPLTTGASGTLLLPFTWPSGVPSGTSIYFQDAIQDAAAIHGAALSNALKGLTP